MMRTFLAIMSVIIPSMAVAQGYFYTESTVQINTGASIEIKGNAVINQSISGNGFIVMNGDNPQTLGGTSASMNNLKVTNNATVTLTDHLWINDTMNMNSGTLYLVDENLYLADNSYHTGNTMGYIETNGIGYIQRKIDNNPFTFHTGVAPEYFPITLTELGAPDTFRIQAWDLLPDNGTSTGSAIINHDALLSFSLMDLAPGGNDLGITMQWSDTKNAVDFVQPYAVGIWYNGSNYVELLNCPTNVNSINPNIISYSGINNIGTYGIGDSLYLTNIPSAYIMPGDTTVCQGSNVIFTAMPSGATYLWNTTAISQTINATAAGNYYVDVTDSTGCVYRSADVTLTTLSLPPVPTITQSDTVLSVSPTYNTYQWYLNGSLIGGANSSSYSIAGNGTYSVVVSGANGCTNTSANLIFNTFGIEEQSPSFNIYNQQGQLHVQLLGDDAQLVYIYDALGKVVYQQMFTSNIMPLELSHGMYVVRVIGNHKEYVKKMIW